MIELDLLETNNLALYLSPRTRLDTLTLTYCLDNRRMPLMNTVHLPAQTLGVFQWRI